MTYSMDLRERVVVAVESGQAITAVARRFSISRPTVRDWRDRAGRGDLTPGTPGPQGPLKLTAADVQRIRDAVAAQPGITAKQLAHRLSVTVSLQTVYRHLNGLGLSLKRNR
jgi:transposase